MIKLLDQFLEERLDNFQPKFLEVFFKRSRKIISKDVLKKFKILPLMEMLRNSWEKRLE